MPSTYKQLKQAADLLDKQADSLESAAKAFEEAGKKTAKANAENAKTASDQEAAQEAAKAELAPLAKMAAAELHNSGLLSSQEQADVFASQILADHKVALNKLGQLAKHAGVPQRAQVVKDDQQPQQKTADDVWADHVRRANQTLGIGNG